MMRDQVSFDLAKGQCFKDTEGKGSDQQKNQPQMHQNPVMYEGPCPFNSVIVALIWQKHNETQRG